MHSIHSQNIEALPDCDDFACTLKLLKDAVVAWEDRAAAAILFLGSEKLFPA